MRKAPDAIWQMVGFIEPICCLESMMAMLLVLKFRHVSLMAINFIFMNSKQNHHMRWANIHSLETFKVIRAQAVGYSALDITILWLQSHYIWLGELWLICVRSQASVRSYPDVKLMSPIIQLSSLQDLEERHMRIIPCLIHLWI